MPLNARTSDKQRVPSRQAKPKHSLKSKLSFYSINGRTPEEQFAGYVTRVFPTTPQNVRERFVAVLMYAYKSGKPIPTPTEMYQMFDGEYVEPEARIPLNPRQNG